MTDLEIKSIDGVPVVSSQVVADHFGKRHDNVVRSIDDLLRSIRESNSSKVRTLGDSSKLGREYFQECELINSRNRAYRGYMMTRDGFSLLAMGFTGQKALEWKLKFISTFNAMEKALMKEADKLEWKQARLQGKAVRKSVTDCIADFVEYAKAQGSKNAANYYANITKMEYAALELIEKGQKVPSSFRETLDTMQLCALTMAEEIAKRAIKDGMQKQLHYKEIYELAKERVIAYAKTINIGRIE